MTDVEDPDRERADDAPTATGADERTDAGEGPADAGDGPADAGNGPADAGNGPADAGEEPRGRDVEVPMRVYKTVTVFSTLFAVALVVLGFVLLDVGTDRAQAALSDVNLALTLGGLAAIALGAGTYAFSTRFRAGGMGKSQDESGRGSDNE